MSDDTEKRIAEIRTKLTRWQDELPKLIQPGHEHIQNVSDIAWLLEQVEHNNHLRTLFEDWEILLGENPGIRIRELIKERDELKREVERLTDILKYAAKENREFEGVCSQLESEKDELKREVERLPFVQGALDAMELKYNEAGVQIAELQVLAESHSRLLAKMLDFSKSHLVPLFQFQCKHSGQGESGCYHSLDFVEKWNKEARAALEGDEK